MELDGRRGVGGARAQHDSRPLRYSLQHLSQPSTIDLIEDGENGLPFEFRRPNEQGPGSYCEGEGVFSDASISHPEGLRSLAALLNPGEGMKRLKEFLATDDKPRAKSNVAQIASALVALVALIGIYVQVHLGRLNALRASARQVYLSYSQATLQHPRLARPNYQHLKDDPDPTELIRYQTYVTSMLEAYDEILDIVDEPEWVAAFRYDVVDHMPYLCEKNDPKYFETFYKKTRRLVAEEKTKHCSNLAPILKSAPSYLPKH